jgi:hypothetical protein
VDGLIGVTGDKAEAPDEVVGGGLMGDRLVGDATVSEERLRDNATVFVLAVGLAGARSG